MRKSKQAEPIKKVQSCKIRSKVKYPVTLEYDKQKYIINPDVTYSFADKSKFTKIPSTVFLI